MARIPPSLVARQSQYVSPRVQAIVLQYSETLQRLYKSLADDSGRQEVFEQRILEARIAMAEARVSLLRLEIEQKRVDHLALRDGLTALPNRRFLLERLDEAGPNALLPRQSFALLRMEFSSRHTLHDPRSSRCNEALLKIVAARLNRAARAEDVVCRLEGDEFACLVPGPPSRVQLAALASALFDAVSGPLRIGTLEFSLQLNTGIALFPADGATADALLDRAAAALRTAKQRKIRYAFFDRSCAAEQYEFVESPLRD
jgi:diguanylate cyclase (GGDEF)-like protein